MEDHRESSTYLYIPLSNIDDEVFCKNNGFEVEQGQCDVLHHICQTGSQLRLWKKLVYSRHSPVQS